MENGESEKIMDSFAIILVSFKGNAIGVLLLLPTR